MKEKEIRVKKIMAGELATILIASFLIGMVSGIVMTSTFVSGKSDGNISTLLENK